MVIQSEASHPESSTFGAKTEYAAASNQYPGRSKAVNAATLAIYADAINHSSNNDLDILTTIRFWNPPHVDQTWTILLYFTLTMERLPEEVILHILSYLDFTDNVSMHAVSHRYLTLSRDDALWKIECFDRSQAESLRRRQQLRNAQDSRLAELRNAVSALPGADLTAWDVSQLRGSAQPRASSDPNSEAKTLRQRAQANWEPAYPGEQLDYYEEFIHRHAPVQLDYLPSPKAPGLDKEAQTTATGVGLLDAGYGSHHVIAPLDDGSICVWDTSGRTTKTYGGGGKLVGQSRRGLLSGQTSEATSESHTIMTETGAVECVAIDSHAHKGYFAVQSLLHEVDLNTLRLTTTKQYPWPITALSEAKDDTPVTVGTNLTIHLHDPRDSAFAASTTQSGNQGELIGGSLYSHATLAQPGPLSILHQGQTVADDSSIWVSGRFTSLLNYDRRFFPRLRGTVFSGARVASLTSLPYSFIPQNLDLVRNPNTSISALLEARSQPGHTIMAAAEYKGKGSLELYGLPSLQEYKNRQTASASKLLSVAPHGGKIVFSDGDGNLKWVERDGYSFVRTFNINDPPPRAEQDASSYGIWSSTASEMPGQGDIVQKMIPTNPTASSTASDDDRLDVNTSNLLLWTGDGYLGLLGFGNSGPLSNAGGEEEESWHDAVESQAQNAEQRAKEDAERQYGMAMRRALERNADEVRFVRGLGMGFMRS